MSDPNKLKEASKEYLSTLAAHRKNPRNYDAVDAWDKASSNFAELTKNNELDIIASLINQLETEEVHRKVAFLACNAWHDKFRKSEKDLEAAEAELARRDAAAGERVGVVEVWSGTRSCDFLLSRPLPVGQHNVYTAAQPSALPPEMTECHPLANAMYGDKVGMFMSGYNQAIADAKALGCKAIKLPKIKHPAQFDYADDVIATLKAQGLSVEGDDDE